ncbi:MULTISPECIES: MaoC family dehydratase [Enterocloster]|uniref:3-hydroxybutyryl-CoA dehydratase n=1 Tax=Enterocloster lavalensis TaxID=460384 RepID=A0A1I0HRX8_9FIRM|nr:MULTISPECIES: MaoC family dehydratase [Enterocloster]MBS5602871.1 MaoC family dehydratase [Enterocloster asparagiformis]MDR3759010.1 MaoC family dehydratase [Enterocloster sp.]PST32210.1 enoyl-CoA hydratase [Enterocloster lavalensis]SET86913.1 3-hydroxybutyryl-CoA dehydratase [Enterocloster lavalensis]
MKQLQLKEVEKTVESIPMGQKAYFSKTVTEGDVALFAGITGAFEPLSMNQEFAEKTPYLSRMVQTMLLATYTWPVSTQIASPGAVTIAQESTFLKPVKIGDTITAVGEVTQKIMEKKIVIVRTTCYNQDGEMVMDGSVVELMRVH